MPLRSLRLSPFFAAVSFRRHADATPIDDIQRECRAAPRAWRVIAALLCARITRRMLDNEYITIRRTCLYVCLLLMLLFFFFFSITTIRT